MVSLIVFFTLYGIVLDIYLRMISLFSKKKAEDFLDAIAQHQSRFFFSVTKFLTGIQIQYQDQVHLDRLIHSDGQNPDHHFIFIANHLSYIDTLALLSCLPPPVRFLFKASLARGFPLFSLATRLQGHGAIKKSDWAYNKRSLDQVIHKIQTHPANILIFPQGTRATSKRSYPPFRSGALSYIWEKTKRPIIYVHITGTDQFLHWKHFIPFSRFWIKKNTLLTVCITQIVDPSQNGIKAALKSLDQC